MNHDYEHCLDETESCPKDCFRKQLNEDLRRNPLEAAPKGFVSWMHFDCNKPKEEE